MTTVDVSIPESMFKRLQKLAKLSNRTVNDLISSTLATNFPIEDDLPEELGLELTAMAKFSDHALQAALKPSMSEFQQTRLEQLNLLASERPLSEIEKSEQTDLSFAYHRSVLRRAQAIAILKERGYPIKELLTT